MPATIHDVAKKAGVGIGTVSSVLNNSRPVNENTRQKVLQAVAELDFVPNPSGRRLSMGKTHTIGVLIAYFTIASQIERLRGVMSVISGSEYDLTLYSVESINQLSKILRRVSRRGQIDGLLIFSLRPTEKDLQRIKQENIPTVLVEGNHPGLHCLAVNDAAAARSAVEYLIQLGHRKIGFIGNYLDDPFDTSFSRNRYQGYIQALTAANIPLIKDYQRLGVHDRSGGRQMALELLNLPDPPTAVFTFSDEQALGVLEAARDLNVSVPQQLSVIGYDDIRLAHFAQLTTVRQHLFDSGQQGIELLLDIISNPNTPPATSHIPTELVIRHTTAPPKPDRALVDT